MQEGGDVLLRPGAAKARPAQRRGAGRTTGEAHRHDGVAPLEEHCQCQRPPPPVCRCLLPRRLRLKKLNLAQLLLDTVIYIFVD